MKQIYFTIFISFIFCTTRPELLLQSISIDTDAFIESYDYLDIIDETRQSEREIVDEEVMSHAQKYNFITISLGCNCHPATYTRNNGIRAFAFPFDWCITPYQSLYQTINNDFKFFFKKENLIASSKSLFSNYLLNVIKNLNYTHSIEWSKFVLDKQSEIIFNHDFSHNDPKTIQDNFQTRYETYQRRIKRFYTAINSGKHIFFIRFYDITKAQSLELYQLLRDKFPHSAFTLIVIGNDKKEFGESWNIPHIKNYFDTPFHPPFWEKLCKDIIAGKLQ